ncbi:MAG TPA: hypothetical protein VNZ61_08760 [Roseomonas sp.]|nr:hypothetical protein [Roseomonas sp.]
MRTTKTVSLRSAQGVDYGTAQIPEGVVGPEAIRRGHLIFIRKTHDVYQLATCHVVPDEPVSR